MIPKTHPISSVLAFLKRGRIIYNVKNGYILRAYSCRRTVVMCLLSAASCESFRVFESRSKSNQLKRMETDRANSQHISVHISVRHARRSAWESAIGSIFLPQRRPRQSSVLACADSPEGECGRSACQFSRDVLCSVLSNRALQHGYRGSPPTPPRPPLLPCPCYRPLVPDELPVPEMDTPWRRPAVAADDLCGAGPLYQVYL